jgi:hypothetical protein
MGPRKNFHRKPQPKKPATRTGRPLAPKGYLRRLIVFENRLLNRIPDPVDRDLARQAASLVNHAHFYHLNPEMTAGEYVGFMDGVSHFMHSPRTVGFYVQVGKATGVTEKKYLAWIKRNLDDPYARERVKLVQKNPLEPIIAETIRHTDILDPIVTFLLRKHGLKEEYDRDFNTAGQLLKEVRGRARREPMGFESDIPL